MFEAAKKQTRKRPKPMDFRLTETLVPQLCAIWPHPATGDKGLKQKDLVEHAGLTKGAVSNYFNGRIPDDYGRDLLSKFFEIVFFSNNPNIDNEKQLKVLEAFFDKHFYQKKAS